MNSPNCCGRRGAARPNPPRQDGDDAEDQKGPQEGPARQAEALQAAACRDVGEKVSREEFRGELKAFVGFPVRRASLLGAAGTRRVGWRGVGRWDGVGGCGNVVIPGISSLILRINHPYGVRAQRDLGFLHLTGSLGLEKPSKLI